jgi:2-polyprenyl-6-methoxyphenol hydroxylase-like FAD-dependent oxidoreductase
MTNSDILISGAGIAGPALAYCLREAGFKPTIVENAPAPRPGGQTVDLRGAGRTMMDRIGLLERARQLSLDQRGFALVDDKGRVTARMPVDAFGGEGIISEIEILRGDLAGLLYEASLPGTEYLFGDTITSLTQDDDGVDVTFAKAPPRRFGLVFGADGLYSTVRRLAIAPPEQAVQAFDLHTAWFTAEDDLDLDGWYLMYNAPGGLVASARSGREPGEIKVALSFRAPQLAVDRRDVAGQKDLVAQHFAGAGWQTPRLLAAMRRSSDFSFESLGQVHLDSWSKGRVALIGDAGYCPSPPTGLGTSLALVGAYVLAGELTAARGDHRVAFDRYENLLRPWVATSQKLPPGGVGGFAPNRALHIRARAASMRWMTRWPMRPMLAKQFAKAGGIELPTYDALSRR